MNQGIWIKSGALLLAFAMLIVMGVGCGGGDDNGDTSAAANSQTSSQAASQGGETAEGKEGAENEEGEGEGGGGGEGGNAETVEGGGQSPMLAEADAICAKSGEEYSQTITPYFSREVKTRKDEEEIYEEVVEQVTVPTIEGRVEALQDLSGSASEEEVIDEMIAKLEAMADEAEAEAVKFGEGPIPAVIDARQTAKKLGVKNCGLLP